MLKLSISEMIEKIDNEVLFTAISEDESFNIIIEKYVPYVCTAIHNGSNLNEELKEKSILTREERWKEEDPLTGAFIDSLPIQIVVNDSRYEYDLNRDEENCIYDLAWGKKVWKTPLNKAEKEAGLNKHRNFYKVLEALVRKIENKYRSCIIYDIHSYNYKREIIHYEYPIFNLGTENIDSTKYKKYIKYFISSLQKISFQHFDTTVAENDVFYGRGYLAKFIKERFKSTLVMPLEIKKIYCDEDTGDVHPIEVESIREGLKNAITANSVYFINKETNRKVRDKANILSSLEDPVLKKVDATLYSLLKNFEILSYVNPRNLERCKKDFFDSKFRVEPEFKYNPLRVDTYELKRKLYKLPIMDIDDISIQLMYKEIIHEYSTMIDMLASRGTEDFLYNSLKLYGKPTRQDVKNANYIIQSAGLNDEEERKLTKSEVLNLFEDELESWGIGGKISFGRNMAARVMVSSSKKTLVINEKAKFNTNDIQLLSQHELGVHMVTTMNANKQPLKFLLLGTPKNIETQEGLAILAECLTGKLHINRLKDLAYRVIAVNLMVKGYSFKEIFTYLMDEYDFSKEKAFDLTARVMRGGGLTKDYVYLKGFIKVYKHYMEGESVEELLVGKTSLEYFELLKELIERGRIIKPVHKNDIYATGDINDPIVEYILKSIK